MQYSNPIKMIMPDSYVLLNLPVSKILCVSNIEKFWNII